MLGPPTENDASRFHWQEGMKYAHEGIKALMLLNGAATIAILTFIGNTQDGDDRLAFAMFCFALGALFGPLSFLFAYLTQLQYGNGNIKAAGSFHRATYWCFLFGILLFLGGVALAGWSFIQLQSSP